MSQRDPHASAIMRRLRRAENSGIKFIGVKSNGFGANATEYMDIGASVTTETDAAFPIPINGVIKNMYVSAGSPPGTNESWVFTLFLNGSGQSLACTMSATETSTNNTSDVVSVSAGGLVSVRVVSSASATTTVPFHASMQLAPE